MRHFIRLYLFLVIAMLSAGWCLELLWKSFEQDNPAVDHAIHDIIKITELRLLELPVKHWSQAVEHYSNTLSNHLMLIPIDEISGDLSVEKLKNHEVISMQSNEQEWWVLKKIARHNLVLIVSTTDTKEARSLLEWLLSLLLYGAIALAVMLWIWPLSRDINKLQQATTTYGNRNWQFPADIKPGSQVHKLGESFRNMAHRIDRLIQSHKDMSNAVSHEINTPLARMKFKIETAEESDNPDQIKNSLGQIKSDINQINDLVSATLRYAILDRADFSLNLSMFDFSLLLPALIDLMKTETPRDLEFEATVQAPAKDVICDYYLLETALKNLLLNASRYATCKIHLDYQLVSGFHQIYIEDDGPGIAEENSEKVFNSFTQLTQSSDQKGKFGLGLAIVKRVMEWHEGDVTLKKSSLGGAEFLLRWPRKKKLKY